MYSEHSRGRQGWPVFAWDTYLSVLSLSAHLSFFIWVASFTLKRKEGIEIRKGWWKEGKGVIRMGKREEGRKIYQAYKVT